MHWQRLHVVAGSCSSVPRSTYLDSRLEIDIVTRMQVAGILETLLVPSARPGQMAGSLK